MIWDRISQYYAWNFDRIGDKQASTPEANMYAMGLQRDDPADPNVVRAGSDSWALLCKSKALLRAQQASPQWILIKGRST